jgi:hypothetical protein
LSTSVSISGLKTASLRRRDNAALEIIVITPQR